MSPCWLLRLTKHSSIIYCMTTCLSCCSLSMYCFLLILAWKFLFFSLLLVWRWIASPSCCSLASPQIHMHIMCLNIRDSFHLTMLSVSAFFLRRKTLTYGVRETRRKTLTSSKCSIYLFCSSLHCHPSQCSHFQTSWKEFLLKDLLIFLCVWCFVICMLVLLFLI